MKRHTHKLDYQLACYTETSYIGRPFCLSIDEPDCGCERPLAQPIEHFIATHQLHYCPDFNEFVNDKCSLYANTDRNQLYWFVDCCSMGSSYATLARITNWPTIRLKTAAELAAGDRFINALRAHMKQIASSPIQRMQDE